VTSLQLLASLLRRVHIGPALAVPAAGRLAASPLTAQSPTVSHLSAATRVSHTLLSPQLTTRFIQLSVRTMSSTSSTSGDLGKKRSIQYYRNQNDNRKRDVKRVMTSATTEPASGESTLEDNAVNVTEVTAESGLDSVTPLWRVPYLMQLKKKQHEVIKVLRRVLRETLEQFNFINKEAVAGKTNKTQTGSCIYASHPTASGGGLVCPLDFVIPSPCIKGYRNKNEFSCGVDFTGAPKVGFQLGRFVEGETRVGSPEGCLSAPDVAIEIAKLAEQFIIQQQDRHGREAMDVWDKHKHSGFFRLVMVRNSCVLGQLMVVLQVNPENLPDFKREEGDTPLPEGASGEAALEYYSARSKLFAQFVDEYKRYFIEQCYAGVDYKPEPYVPVPPIKPAQSTREKKISGDATEVKESKSDVQESLGTEEAQGEAPTADSESSMDNIEHRSEEWLAEAEALKQRMIQHAETAWQVACDAGVAGAEGLTRTDPIFAQTQPTDTGKAFAARTGHSLTSLCIQIYTGISNAASESAPIISFFGPPWIYDVICERVFRVNVNSFFQVNKYGAEVLYRKAVEWALSPPHDFEMTATEVVKKYAPACKDFYHPDWTQLQTLNLRRGNPPKAVTSSTEGEVAETKEPTKPVDHKDTILLDICCGTGTIGLSLASRVKKVVGLELVESAVEDAKRNMALNKIKNAEFICGRAEATINGVLAKYGQNSQVVGIVDPPRSGLHNDVVRALRNSKLNRIVYVSCNPATLADNVARLAGPATKKYPGMPFVPVAAAAVDMFPHTQHCELVMLLERPTKPASTVGVEEAAQIAKISDPIAKSNAILNSYLAFHSTPNVETAEQALTRITNKAQKEAQKEAEREKRRQQQANEKAASDSQVGTPAAADSATQQQDEPTVLDDAAAAASLATE